MKIRTFIFIHIHSFISVQLVFFGQITQEQTLHLLHWTLGFFLVVVVAIAQNNCFHVRYRYCNLEYLPISISILFFPPTAW